MDNSKAVVDWLSSLKSERTRIEYEDRWRTWLEYCSVKAIAQNGDSQLEDMKQKRLSKDNTEKYFYDNEVPMFFQWLRTEYKQKKGRNKGEPLSEASALAVTTAVRSFFSFHRYGLQIKKESLPSSEKVKGVYEDHEFDIYQLRAMFQQGDLFERTVLACGKDLWFRASDFTKLERDTIDYLIKAEKDLAKNENREPDIVEFEIITQKEKEPCSCHLSKESVELVEEYIKTYPKKNGSLFPIGEEALTDVLRRLADKAKISIKPNTRIRWHCLRKFGITLMHGKVTEPVMKYMVGKHISKDLLTYIQNNRETFKAFKLVEPLISLTKTNGNGNIHLAKELEEMRKETFKRIAQQKLIEKLFTKEQLQQAMKELAEEYGLDIEVQQKTKLEPIQTKKAYTEVQTVEMEPFIEKLAEKIEKQNLDRILKENGNNE